MIGDINIVAVTVFHGKQISQILQLLHGSDMET